MVRTDFCDGAGDGDGDGEVDGEVDGDDVGHCNKRCWRLDDD